MTTKQENILVLRLPNGEVHVELLPEHAPKHVKRIRQLALDGFYDNCPFHRVIDGFMAQTGDGKNRDGTGGSDYPNLAAEFNDQAHERGTVSMARTSDPNSANSQFFICFDKHPHLDRQYTVFGKVAKGMEYIDQLKKGSGHSGSVAEPDCIQRAYILSDSPAD